MPTRRVTRALIAASVAVGFASEALSQAFTWTNPAGGTFSVASNWNPAGPPSGATQSAVFNLPASYAVSLVSAASHGTLSVTAGSINLTAASPQSYGVSTMSIAGATVNLASVSLSTSGVGTIGPGGWLNISATGTFSASQNVVVNGGSLIRANTAVNSFTLAAGRTLIIQGGGLAQLTGGFELSTNRAASITDGQFVLSSFLDIGNSGNATLTANGASASVVSGASGLSFWGVAGGVGEAAFFNGAVGTFSGGVRLGDNIAGSLGRLQVASASFNVGSLNVGTGAGSGEVIITGGTSVVSVLGAADVNVGATAAAATTGTVSVQGGSFSAGNGLITVNARGLVNVGSLATFTAGGNLLINGGTFTNQGAFSQSAGRTIAVQNGGIFTHTPAFTMAPNQNLTVTGGTFSTAGALAVGVANSASIVVTGPSARLTAAGAVSIGNSGGVGSVLVVNNAVATFSSAMIIGSGVGGSASGTLFIDTGGQVTSGNCVVSENNNAGAVLLNSGTWTAGNLDIGTFGSVNINSGGRLGVTGDLTINGGTLQRNAGGTLALTAGRSLNILNGGLLDAGFLLLPNGFNAIVQSGGRLRASFPAGTIEIGSGILTSGTLTVLGSTSSVAAANDGTATFGRSSGTATATFNAGAGTFGVLRLGFDGGGATLNVTGGATVHCTSSLLLGVGSPFTGFANVNINGPNSLVQTGTLQTGGSVTINIGSGATLRVLNSTQLNAGIINLNGGTADLGSLLHTPPAAVNFTSGAVQFTGVLTTDALGLLGASPVIGPNMLLSIQGVPASSFVHISPFTTFTLAGGRLNCPAIEIDPLGSFAWTGGTLNFVGAAPPAIDPAGPLGADVTINTGKTLIYDAELSITSAAVLTQRGGRVQAGAMNLGGAYYYDGGQVAIGTATVAGRLNILPSRSLTLGSPVTNAAGGRIELFGGGARLTGTGSISNSGVITGDGEITKPIVQSATGEIRVDNARRLAVASLTTSAGGRITLGGGTLEAGFTNGSLSTVSGRGSLVGAINNFGTIALSGGISDQYRGLTNSNAGKTIISGGAVATFFNDVTNTGTSEFRISTGSTAVFFGTVTGTGHITGTGTAVFEGSTIPGAVINGGTSVVGPAGELNATVLRQVALRVEGQANFLPGGSVSRVNDLSIAGAPGAWLGAIDLADNSLILDYTGPTPRGILAEYLRSGFAAGAWTGRGIASSVVAALPNRAIGLADAIDLGAPGSFLGEPIDASTLLLRFTLPGDANLDRAVNIADFGLLAANFNLPAYWARGDFNYDGITGIADFALLAGSFNQVLPGDAPGQRGHVAAVPEGGIAPVCVGVWLARRRARPARAAAANNASIG